MSAKLICRVILAIIVLFAVPSLKASHYSAGEMFYEWIGDEPGQDPHDYRVFATLYRNLSGASMGRLDLNACAFNGPNGSRISFTLNYLNPQASLPPNYKKWWNDLGSHPADPLGWRLNPMTCSDSMTQISEYRYVGEVTLPGRSANWHFAIDPPCCRDGNDNLIGTNDFYLEVDLNNLNGPNNSPHITSSAAANFCITSPSQPMVHWKQEVKEFDGDRLFIDFASSGSLYGGCGGPAKQVPYDSNYTSYRPFPVHDPIQIDHQNGIFKFRPSLPGRFVVKVVVREFRFDSLTSSWSNIGNTAREIIIVVAGACNAQDFTHPEICMLSFDPESQLNRVFLKDGFKKSDSLFFLQALKTQRLKTDNLSQASIYDSSASGIGRPFKGQLSAFSNCQFYTDTSQIHENMQLSAQWIDSGKVSVNWSPYKGRGISAYRIYEADRSFDSIRPVAQVANNVFSYVLPSIDSTTTYILLEGVLDSGICLPDSFSFDGPLSATGFFGIGMQEQQWSEVAIFPNPTENLIKVDWPYRDERAYVLYNLQGKIIQNGILRPALNRLSLAEVPGGLYLLKIDGLVGSKRVIKQ